MLFFSKNKRYTKNVFTEDKSGDKIQKNTTKPRGQLLIMCKANF